MSNIALFAPTLGAALIVIGVAWGISRIGKQALESIARQPDAADDIRNAMILGMGMIEGLGIIGAIICLLTVFFLD